MAYNTASVNNKSLVKLIFTNKRINWCIDSGSVSAMPGIKQTLNKYLLTE